jgi:M6 family metalloprotease-like protein
VKRSKLFLVLALVGVLATCFAAPGAVAAPAAQSQVKLTLPDYSPIDREVRTDAAAAGAQVTGKELKYNPGHSYKSPGNGTTVGAIDVRGHGLKGLAILADWPSEGCTGGAPGVNYDPLPQSLFNNLVNGTTYNPYTLPMFSHLATYNGQLAPTDRTMKNYYNEVSYGQFGMTVDMVGWVTLPHCYDYYLGQNKGFYNENGDAFMGELIRDAIDAARAQGLNLADYAVDAKPGDFGELYGSATSFQDKNGNTISKIVPNLFVIHRGSGAEFNLDPGLVWSHKWDILSALYYGQYYQTGVAPADSDLEFMVRDGVVVNTYNTVPEVGQDITGYYYGTPKAPSPPYVGVFAHEFGHVLGLPDLYDYGYDSEGVGDFSLMAGGSWGRTIAYRYYSGNSPTHMDGWSKQYLGFLQFKDITPSTTKQTITLRPVETNKDVYRILIPGAGAKEYFVLENRQQIGFDKGMLDMSKDVHGLVVYQVDETVLARNFDRPNEANNWDWNKRGDNFRADTGENHFAVSVIQADGQYQLETNASYGDAGDVFPGIGNVTTLQPNPVQGQPNTVSWYQWAPGRSITGITLSNIVEKDGVITLDVTLAK